MLNPGDKTFGLLSQSMGGAKSPLAALPMQAETTSAIRACGLSTAALIESLNRFFYEAKQDGATFGAGGVTDLYLFASDTQSGAVQNLVPGAGRTATLSGAPTFTARKGYDFSSTGNFSIPFGGSYPFFAGKIDYGATSSTTPLVGVSSATGASADAITVANDTGVAEGYGFNTGRAGIASAQYGVIGCAGSNGGTTTPGGLIGHGPTSAGGPTGSPHIGLVPTSVSRLSAYGAYTSVPDLRRFLSRLAGLLDDIGALN